MPPPSLSELARVFGQIGLISFGGPAAQISLLQQILVEDRKWLTEKQFLNALSFCMLLPGPEAMQLATYAGWRLRGTPGGLIAGGLFILPGAAAIMALAWAYATFGDMPLVAALFIGVKAAVVVVVLRALTALSRRALRGTDTLALALLAFIIMFFFDIPFPAVIAGAAIWGGIRRLGSTEGVEDPGPGADLQRTLRTAALWGALWLAPLALLLAAGPSRLAEIATFFAWLAVVTFGGAYAVLAYMAEAAVDRYGWLTAPQMIDALGLAETTPGPLILVTQFVGFLAAWPGGAAAALLAALVTLWMTFAPCFLWIFAGAPWIEAISAKPRLRGALAGITAAVVGVILDLSIWFATHVYFSGVDTLRAGPIHVIRPDFGSLDLVAASLSAIAASLLFLTRWPLHAVLPALALLGAAWHLAV